VQKKKDQIKGKGGKEKKQMKKEEKFTGNNKQEV
jgi:hypothetical protein